MLSSIKFSRASLVAALFALPTLAATADTLTVTRLGDGIPTGLSADGKAVVGFTPGVWGTFRWTASTGIVDLGRSTADTLGIRSGIPRISANGNAVSATILSDDGTYSTAGRWTVQEGWKMLAPPLPPGGAMVDGNDASAFGMSGDAKTVTGLFWRPGQPGGYAHGMAWTKPTGMLDMGSSGDSSRIENANYDGSVMVGWDQHPMYGNWRAAVWVKGVLTVLVDSDWPSQATAVNSDGTIIVGEMADPANDYQQSAAMWKWNGSGWTTTVLGVMHKTGKPGFAYPEAVSDDGSVVVGTARLDANKPNSVGFIWTPAGGMVEMETYLKANGVRRNPLARIIDVSAVTPDGTMLVATEAQLVAPYASRALLIKRQAAAAR